MDIGLLPGNFGAGLGSDAKVHTAVPSVPGGICDFVDIVKFASLVDRFSTRPLRHCTNLRYPLTDL